MRRASDRECAQLEVGLPFKTVNPSRFKSSLAMLRYRLSFKVRDHFLWCALAELENAGKLFDSRQYGRFHGKASVPNESANER